MGYQVEESPAPIVGFNAGSRADMQALQARLFDRGIYILLSNYLGAGPEGLLRAAVYADHCDDDIEQLLACLKGLS